MVHGVRFNYDETLDADVMIDATGDGHVAYLAGAPYEQGEGGDPPMCSRFRSTFLWAASICKRPSPARPGRGGVKGTG